MVKYAGTGRLAFDLPGYGTLRKLAHRPGRASFVQEPDEQKRRQEVNRTLHEWRAQIREHERILAALRTDVQFLEEVLDDDD